MNKSAIKVVEKGWGRELWIHNDDKYCGKVLVLEKGKNCSLHFHVKKHETFYVSKGLVQMELIEKNGAKTTMTLQPGDALEIPPGLVHRFTGLEDSEIMEFSTEHFDEDSYRVETGSQLAEPEQAEKASERAAA
jgi:quercetin dioxygenase-like cupin family protein